MNYVCGKHGGHCHSSKLGVTFRDPAAMSIKDMTTLKSDDIILGKKSIWAKRSDQPGCAKTGSVFLTHTINGCYRRTCTRMTSCLFEHRRSKRCIALLFFFFSCVYTGLITLHTASPGVCCPSTAGSSASDDDNGC